MFTASDSFHKAVADGEPQIAMLIFEDAVFTNPDINVENGIEFDDNFSLEEDIAIGQTPANEIRFSLFNDEYSGKRLLNNYKFGDFLATIGVLVANSTYAQTYPVTVKTVAGSQKNTWTGDVASPYLRKNGLTVSSPGFPVRAIMAYDGKVYAFDCTGEAAVYDDATGQKTGTTDSLNAFMRNKSKSWEGKGLFYNKNNRMLYIYEGGKCDRYEFVPLGCFTAERPKAPDVLQIDMVCHDYMLKFDKDMPSAKELGITYPVTISNLYKALCNYVGVQYASANFINSTAKINSEPEEFKTATMRDVLKWIAEAAASIARFNRDGVLILDWIHPEGQTMGENDYASFDPYWYQTRRITKLHNRASDGSFDNTKGTGAEEYLIQDNPLLKGVK